MGRPQCTAGIHYSIDPMHVLQRLPVQPGNIVADLGCGGAGHFVFASAALAGERGEVYAVDLLKGPLTAIEGMAQTRRISTICTLWSNIELVGATPLPDGYVHNILFVNILSVLSDRESAFQEGMRLLKPNGRMLIIDWKTKNDILGPPLEQRISAHLIKKYAHKYSLVLQDEFDVSRFHYGIILKK